MMDQSTPLVRLVYISQATFKPFQTSEGVECNVAQILAVSRKNNAKNKIFGALYYGNGNFFQSLEGEKTAIETLVAKIQLDSRHKNFKILHQEPITQPSFQNWEMKYAMLDQQARDFMKQHGLARFDPYQFNLEMTKQFEALLLASAQEVPEEALQQAAATEIPESQRLADTKAELSVGQMLLAILLLLLIVLLVAFLVRM